MRENIFVSKWKATVLFFWNFLEFHISEMTWRYIHYRGGLLFVFFVLYQWKWSSLSGIRLFVTTWTIWSMEFSRLEYWRVAFPFSWDLPNPGIEPRSPTHCRQILYQLSHQGNPRILEWVAYPFSSRSFQPRNRTWSPALQADFFLIYILFYFFNLF